jgi:hypothetical protein
MGSHSRELAAIQSHSASFCDMGIGVKPKGGSVGDASGASPFTAVVLGGDTVVDV